MSDLEQRRRTVRVLELLDESYDAHQRGDNEAAGRLIAEANEVDAFAVTAIHGGMFIGEVPSPERNWVEWVAYVDAAKDALARAEEEAGADG